MPRAGDMIENTLTGERAVFAATRHETEGKRLQLLKEALPTISRVAVLAYGSLGPSFAREQEAAARVLGLTLQYYGVRNPEELAGAFTAMTKKGAKSPFLMPDSFWYVGNQVQRIVELAAQSRLLTAYPHRAFVKAGAPRPLM